MTGADTQDSEAGETAGWIGAGAARAAIAALPERPYRDIFGAEPVLLLAPHQDDEALGCGGMLAEAARLDCVVHVAFLTDGGMSHPRSLAWPRARLVAERRAEALRATAILGVPLARVTFLEAPDAEAPHAGPHFEALLQLLCAMLRATGCGVLCASWIGDPHGDHGAAAKLAAAARARTGVRHLAYPVWAWTVPDAGVLPPVSGGARLDIAAHLPAKRRAIAAHATQHAGLITDDPDGFALPASFLAHFERPWEAFLDMP